MGQTTKMKRFANACNRTVVSIVTRTQQRLLLTTVLNTTHRLNGELSYSECGAGISKALDSSQSIPSIVTYGKAWMCVTPTE